MREFYKLGVYFVRTHGILALFFGRVLLETAIPPPTLPVREVKLCNGTFNSSLLSEAISLRLPDLLMTSLGMPIYCWYKFAGVEHQKVSIRLTELYTGVYDEASESCKNGYLGIWDGSRVPGRHRYPPNTFCGNYKSGDLDVEKISTGTLSEMEFVTSDVDFLSSFHVTVRFIDIEKDATHYSKQIQHSMQLATNTASVCDWIVQLEDCEQGCPVLSPGYPGIYPPNTVCSYHVISQNPHVAFQIKGSGLNIEQKPREFNLRRNCREDYLDIYEGNSTESSNRRIGRFCGRDLPDITTSSNDILLVFGSGADSPPYTYNGFHLSAIGVIKEWHQDGYAMTGSICGWVFNSSAGSVSSPEHWLPEKTACEYSFNVNAGNYLQIILNIYGLDRLCKDYIMVQDGSRVLQKICEEHLRDSRETFVFNLTAPYVVIKYFTTSGQMEGHQSRGFWMSFRQIRDPKPTRPVTESNEKAQPVIKFEIDRGSHLSYTATFLPTILVPLYQYYFLCAS